MSNQPNPRQWWRSPVARGVTTVILLTFIIGGIFLPPVFQTHAANNRPSNRLQGPPLQQSLKKQEGDWFQLSHFGSFSPAPDARITAIAQAKGLPKSNISGTWSPLGPQPIDTSKCPPSICGQYGLVSGRITAVAFNPGNSNEVWAGAADGGLWHSTDGGAHWAAVTDTQPTLSIGSIAVDPNNPSTIYVGTGEANSNIDAYWGVGILKSTDDGSTWTNYGFKNFGGLGIGKIVVDPANSQILLLSAIVDAPIGPPGGPSKTNKQKGIWRSTNGGSSWTHVLTGSSPSTPGTDVAFDPANPNVAFAGLGGLTTASGIYTSTDNGQTWKRISAGLPTGNSVGRVSLGISSNGTHLYAVMANSKGDLLGNAIYISTNSGTNWKAQKVSKVPGMVDDDSEDQWWYDSVVGVDPTDSSGKTVFVGGVDLWNSNDAGKTWVNLTNTYAGGSVHADQHALAFFGNPHTNSSFYLGNDGGVWSSQTGGDSFNDLNSGGLNITQFYSGSIGETGMDAQLYGGAQDNGEDQYPTGATGQATWNEVYGGDGGDTAVDYTNNAVVYEETYNGVAIRAINRSTNGGNTWSPAGFNSGDPSNFVMPFVMSPNNNNELLAGTNRVYRTTDQGSSWNVIGGPFDGSQPISAIVVAPSNDNYIYVGDDAGQVHETTNGGSSWNGGKVSGSTGGMVRGIAVDPSNPSIVYVSFANFASGKGHHLFKSTNAGASWSDISSTLPNIPFSSVLVIQNQVVVGSDVGVFASSDGGSTWSQLGSGLPNVAIDQVFANRSGTKLFLATHGRGMWVLPLAASGGNLWITGHDADYHCSAEGEQCNYLKVAVNFVTNGSTLPILALDHGSEVATAIDDAFGGSGPAVTTIDPRSQFAGLPLVDKNGKPLYSAIVVASDTTCGGCDNNDAFGVTPDSDAINARSSDIQTFFNAGGGILGLAGADNISVFYNFLPIQATGEPTTSPYTLTSLGLSLGLIEGPDDNCCATHNSFDLPINGNPFQVAETDAAGLAETMIVMQGMSMDWVRPNPSSHHGSPHSPQNVPPKR